MPVKSKKNTGSAAGGLTFNIHGGVHAGRDVIQGDQYNYGVANIENIQTSAEFTAALQQLRAQIAEIKKSELTAAQARNVEFVETKVAEAVQETRKLKPLGERIHSTLSEAKETMDMLAGSLQSAMVLGTTLGGLAILALKLFGM